MPQQYKIAEVGNTRTFETKFGEMTSYKILLQGMRDEVELAQKTTTPAPRVGDELYGYIQDTNFGPKFKKEKREGGFTPSATSSQSTSFSKSKGSKFESDPFTMYLSYAKDILVAKIEAGHVKEDVSYDSLLDILIAGGNKLYNGRPGAEEKTETPKDKLPDESTITQGEPLTQEELNQIPF